MHHLATRDHQAAQYREYGRAPCAGAFTKKNENFHPPIVYISARDDKHPATQAGHPNAAQRQAPQKRRNAPS